MSTFTDAEYDQIKAAYLALMSGERTVSVSWGDKSIVFQQANIDKLRSLMNEIANDLSDSSNDGSFRIVQHGKNL